MNAVTQDIRRWMFETALPFWSRNGVDFEHGGYVEAFDPSGRPVTEFKRVRVICRQIYVFSHAAMLGFEGADALSEHGYRFLVDHAWQGDDLGWARRLDRDGNVLDGTPDLYDIAFSLFALAWRARCSGDKEPIAWAHKTLDHLDAHMRHPSGEGFLHEAGSGTPRLQNPHMHLLEASLALMEADPHPRFRALADEVSGLFAKRFYDPATRTLAEYFEDDWSREAGERGRWIEPGHQLEWAWILAQYSRLTGVDRSELAVGLIDFAETHGLNPTTDVVYNGVRDDGVLLDGASRIWPNTERLKGLVARQELGLGDQWGEIERSARVLLDRYLAVEPAGTWYDVIDAENRPVVNGVPTSSLYHLFLAFAEVLRLADKD